jgi:8-oxo-dGTP pyrophosphatase MutT (NUDIX family)
MSQAPNYFYHQSAVIPYRMQNGEIEVLLITSFKRKRWVIPKGVIEPALSAGESAAHEAWEEAGLVGQVSTSSIGSYDYDKWGGTCHVEVFLMLVEKVLDDWPEAGFRDRQWVSVAEAAWRVNEKKLKQLLISLPKSIDN